LNQFRARGDIVDIVSYEENEVDTKDIKFDFHEDKEDAVPTVKAATINKLIERLTSSKYSGNEQL
jgi:excinuclease UvrABC helicase subunit UvrB